ncbi:hypothetical protein CSB45_02505 [candidate division KSB3 bacterium]|uniref:CinA-like protein n=1 Tax=candidate division KSB3 bacterium TaxID=2044937 RepID=A0A2G6E9Y7_9BACT|nr:MAG: hypothetical protein CSB45_02505 [candidate division KSB3 bacterium]PIE30951.1 MAG: hypothetical protein CSA57_01120 [candidate division KSB3 bacterium]
MSVEIIAAGSEFIIQDSRNSGIAPIATQLLEAGVEIDYVSAVSAQESRLEEILRQAIERSTLIFVLGSVVSGEYDISKKLLTRVLKKRLVLNYKLLDAIKQDFQDRGEVMPRSVEKQALVPTDADILENDREGLPGFIFHDGQTRVVLMPAHPTAVETMLAKHILPHLNPKRFRSGAVSGVMFKSCGLPLEKVRESLKGLDRDPLSQLLRYVSDGEETSIIVTVKGDIQSDVDSRLQEIRTHIQRALGQYIYGTGSQTLAEVVGELLLTQQHTLALAESCTGGLIANRLTNIAGSSHYFERGVVSYSNEAKISLLDISPNLIEQHGAVSPETAVAMAEGIRWIAQTHYGLAVTGIAGPGGGTREKPVGLVYIALAAEGADTQWKKCHFSGDRLSVKNRTAQTALNMLRHHLLKAH